MESAIVRSCPPITVYAIPGNPSPFSSVQTIVRRRLWAVSILIVAASLAGAAYDHYASAKQKFDSIEAGRLPSGARVLLTIPELNAWVAREAPAGVRNPRSEENTSELQSPSNLV